MTIGVPMTMPNGVSKTSVSPTQPTKSVYNVNSSLPNESGAIETYKEGTALNTTSVFIGVVVGALVVGGGAMWTRRPLS